MTTTTTALTPAQQAARITLKGYRSSAALSRETTAFAAKLCLDGRVVGTCENDGHGGPNVFHTTTPETLREILAIIAAQPATVCSWGTLPPSADFFLGDLVAAEERKKERASLARKAAKVPPGYAFAVLVYAYQRVELRAPVADMDALIAKASAKHGQPNEVLRF